MTHIAQSYLEWLTQSVRYYYLGSQKCVPRPGRGHRTGSSQAHPLRDITLCFYFDPEMGIKYIKRSFTPLSEVMLIEESPTESETKRPCLSVRIEPMGQTKKIFQYFI